MAYDIFVNDFLPISAIVGFPPGTPGSASPAAAASTPPSAEPEKDERRVIYAVYSEKKTFLGFKADTFWTLIASNAKVHTIGRAEELVTNYLAGLNGPWAPEWAPLFNKIYIVEYLYDEKDPLSKKNPLNCLTLQKIEVPSGFSSAGMGKWTRVATSPEIMKLIKKYH